MNIFGEKVNGVTLVPSRTVEADFTNSTTPIDAAEAAYDLSNNPRMESTWRDIAGSGIRSLSVGDVVQVCAAGHKSAFLCLPHSGWADITLVQESIVSRLEQAGSLDHRRDLVARL